MSKSNNPVDGSIDTTRRSLIQTIAGMAVMDWSLDEDGDGDYLDDLLGLNDEDSPISLTIENNGAQVAEDLGVLNAGPGIDAAETSTGTVKLSATGKSSGIPSIGRIDAQKDSIADLNNALQNNADGALIYNGVLTIDASVELPAGKTLYLYNGAGVRVEDGLSHGSLNTRPKNVGPDVGKVIDAAGNSDCGIVCIGGMGIIDANITGDKSRFHVDFFGGTQNHYIQGPLEVRGGRGIIVVDVEEATLEKIFYNINRDDHTLGSGIIVHEGSERVTYDTLMAIGDNSLSTNVTEVVDLNQAGKHNTVRNIIGIDIANESVDITDETGTTVKNVKRYGAVGSEPAAVAVAVKDASAGVHTEKSGVSSDNLTVRDVVYEPDTASSNPAVRVKKNGDGSTGRDMTFTGIKARGCRLFDYVELGSPTESNTMTGLTVRGKSRNCPGDALRKQSSRNERDWTIDVEITSPGKNAVYLVGLPALDIDVSARNPGSDGVVLDSISSATGTIKVLAGSADGFASSNVTKSLFNVVLNDNGGYGLNASGSDNNRYQGVAQGNASGASNGAGAGSTVNLT
ncbi:hypothetical protein [Haloarcula sp. Atlit-120R]|uniref:hypothetical protein n=1 Tax=Haloarcula sp. Atlit-120R TaxID=2282135 RepID=UPI000EF22444|nr:hypothetical protein [Haloarcula sp. Atlit-120R]RLM32609.1 hypothetical protein DVK01_20260 [Haloarcula sp. Atlit-120R]